jgi:histidine ammonia-lyase
LGFVLPIAFFSDCDVGRAIFGMSEAIELRPGLTPLADWRAIYRGAAMTLDPIARADVEAGRTALTEILSRNSLPQPTEFSSPSVAELVEKRGEPLPSGLLRLFVALKIASLAQGMSGVRWRVIDAIAEFLSHDLLPLVAAENADDRIALAHLFSALTGTGEVLQGGKIHPAQKALKAAGLVPLKLNPRERAALLSGTQLSLAAALAGVFEAERVFQSAVVAAALSAAGQAESAFHPTVHRLHRQRGQVEVASAFRHILGSEAPAASEAEDHPSQLSPIRLGAALDLLRYAGATLERGARGVSEDRLVLWQSDDIVAGTSDLSSVALASDLIALALRTIGDLSEALIAAAASARASGSAANENATGLEARAAAFVAENRERARPSALAPQAVWRLMPMAGVTALIVAIEFLEATRVAEARTEGMSAGLNAVLQTVRGALGPASGNGVAAATNLASVGALVGSGALAAATGIQLPSLGALQPERASTRLGDRAKRT